MAHAVDRLVLLYSYPDTVRDSTLHKTLKSSRLTARSQPYGEPRGTFGLAMADCKYRAPPTPHLAQYNNYSRLLKILQVILPTFNQNALLNLKILLKYDKGNDENTRIIARAHRESGWLRTDRYGLYRILSEPRAQAEKVSVRKRRRKIIVKLNECRLWRKRSGTAESPRLLVRFVAQKAG